jgi:hypothetical protein
MSTERDSSSTKHFSITSQQRRFLSLSSFSTMNPSIMKSNLITNMRKCIIIMRRDGRFAHSSRAQEDTLFVAGSNNNVDYATATFGAELNCACSKCEQGVVFAFAYVHTRVKVSAALTNDDFARVYFLTCVTLYAKTLCV